MAHILIPGARDGAVVVNCRSHLVIPQCKGQAITPASPPITKGGELSLYREVHWLAQKIGPGDASSWTDSY